MIQLTKLLLTTLILSLGFGQLLRFELFGLPLYLHDLLVVMILALNLRGWSSQAIPRWFRLIALGLVVGSVRGLTLFPLAELAIPMLYSLRLLAYLSLYLFLFHKPLAISRKLFLLSGAITLAIGLAQYIFLPDMRVFQYLGWDDHLSRLTLPHFDPTFTGAMLGIYLVSTLIPRISLAPIPNTLYAIPYTISILLTYSRSIWLSLVLTGLVFIKNKKALLLLVACILFAIFALPQKFGEGTNLLRTYSISSRYTHDLNMARRVGWNSLSGIGYNTLPLLEPTQSEYPDHATSFNNSFLTIIATSGLIGLAGWLLFLRTLYTGHPHLRPALVFVLIGSIFNNLLLYPFIILIMILQTIDNKST